MIKTIQSSSARCRNSNELVGLKRQKMKSAMLIQTGSAIHRNNFKLVYISNNLKGKSSVRGTKANSSRMLIWQHFDSIYLLPKFMEKYTRTLNQKSVQTTIEISRELVKKLYRECRVKFLIKSLQLSYIIAKIIAKRVFREPFVLTWITQKREGMRINEISKQAFVMLKNERFK